MTQQTDSWDKTLHEPQIEITDSDFRRFLKSLESHTRKKVTFPRRLKPRLMALHHILNGFEFGSSYNEEEVNSNIRNRNVFAIDHIQLRRYLVDYGMLGRRGDGSEYKRVYSYLALARWDNAVTGASGFAYSTRED